MISSPEKTRLAILRTALHLFTTKGYFNTSVHDIRRSADISIGSIYHHFGSKEAIAAALYDDLVQKMTAEIEAIKAEHRTAHDCCRRVVERLFELTATEPDLMLFILHAKHQEFMPSIQPICSSRPFILMKEMVEEGMAAGEIENIDPTIAAAALFGGPLRLIHLSLDGILTLPLAGLLEDIWRCAWRSIAASTKH